MISTPLFGNSSAANGYIGYCGGGDDFDCYRPAQIQLITSLSRAKGCVVVLTGDSHFSDIKAVQGGSGHPYTQVYRTQGLPKPIHQVRWVPALPAVALGLPWKVADRPCPAGHG